jgi:hypothetical protein
MSYEIELTAKAAERLSALEVEFGYFIRTHLVILGDRPTSVARRVVSPPYPPGGMIDEFDYWEPDFRHHFTVFFRYSKDETRLIVTFIGYTAYERDE